MGITLLKGPWSESPLGLGRFSAQGKYWLWHSAASEHPTNTTAPQKVPLWGDWMTNKAVLSADRRSTAAALAVCSGLRNCSIAQQPQKCCHLLLLGRGGREHSLTLQWSSDTNPAPERVKSHLFQGFNPFPGGLNGAAPALLTLPRPQCPPAR